MRNSLRKLIVITIVVCSITTVNAQQVATFDNLTLAPDSYWNGSTTKGGPKDTVTVDTTFLSGDAIFPNTYHKKYKIWSKGWAYSSKTDSITAGYTNMYSAITASGHSSANYAVGTNNAIIRLNKNAAGGNVNGMYITNGTYAAISMRDGDQFARKFGDTTGTHSGLPQGSYPDWFKLTIKGYSNGNLKTDSVEFYLADYRFADNSKDYIVKTWKWVDLTSLGNVDSLIFKLSSTDIAPWGGFNTPAYFCIDNFTTAGVITGISAANENAVKMYPNPAGDELNIDLSGLNGNEIHKVEVLDIAGRRVEAIPVNSPFIQLPVSHYPSGIYFISVKTATTFINAKFIKN